MKSISSTGTIITASGESHTSQQVPMPTVDQLATAAVSKVSPAVVEVKNVGVGLGSGEIVTKNGYIVTNNHVVAGGNQYRVALPDGKTLTATLIGTDPVDDLAVVKINAGNLPTVIFGNSTALQVGQTVLAIGNPLGITHTVTEGIVSALNRTVEEGQGGGNIPQAIQTSAPINPGNSGGALINLAGQVVGIPTLTAIDPEFNAPATGIGFAIPSNRVVYIISQLIHNGKITHSGRAALGVLVEPVDQQLAMQYNLPVDHGMLIAGFSSNSPSKKAGLQKGDIIVKAAGKPISGQSDLLSVLASHSIGDTIQVTVVTPSGSQKTYSVTLGELSINSNG